MRAWYRCVLCKIGMGTEGHNAQPLSRGRCCDTCNTTRVIPYRMHLMGLFPKSHWGEEE